MRPDALSAEAAVARAFRAEYGRTIAVVMRMTGDLQAAEDAVSEAFASASASWPTAGVPPNPQAWIVTVAKRRAIDGLRRRQSAHIQAQRLAVAEAVEPTATPELDDELRLMLLCAHHALSPEAQVTLTLRFVGGLAVDEIARLFAVAPSTIGQRISRAKEKIRANFMVMTSPEPAALSARLSTVMAVIYGVFNEGYVATHGDLMRIDLANEAIRLARELVRLTPRVAEARGLLALLLLLDARREARVAPDGALIVLAKQDRGRWDHAAIAEGQQLVRSCLAQGTPGPYQLQAAIQAVHSDAVVDDDTDWRQLRALYDHLFAVQPTAAVATARALSVERTEGPAAALRALEGVEHGHYTDVVRGHIAERAGDRAAAVAAYRRAAAAAQNDVERAHVERLAAAALR